MILDAFLQPSGATRLLHLLHAAQPFLTPSWCRLTDLCICFLNVVELVSNPQNHNVHRLLQDVRACSPTDNMDGLLCAIRPFCLEEELKYLQMFEQFQQMQKAMDLWQMFSDLAPDFMANTENVPDGSQPEQDTPSPTPFASSHTQTGGTETFLAFLSPEQRALYDSILAEDDTGGITAHSEPSNAF